MVTSNVPLTSAALWQDAVVVALIAAIWVTILVRRIDRARFGQLRWPLVAMSAVFWSALGTILVQVFWGDYYRYFYPGWLHDGGILVMTIPSGAVLALLFHWMAPHLPGHPLVAFCLLGGLKSWLDHLCGIYIFKILDIPLLQGVSPASILAFALPEYVVYWCIVISAAAVTQVIWQRWTGLRQSGARAA
jgi:hypothetical protein